MIKIKVSYEKPRELERVVKLLSPEIKSCKTSEKRKGKYKNAHIELAPEKEKDENDKQLYEMFGI